LITRYQNYQKRSLPLCGLLGTSNGKADEVDETVLMEDGQNGYDAFAALVGSSLRRGANVSIRSGYAPQDLGIVP
jgi:hypothetical protein